MVAGLALGHALRYLPSIVASSLHPTEGIRLLLERSQEDSPGASTEVAHYRAAIYTVTDCFWYQATLSMDGSATLVAEAGPGSSADEERLRKLAKSTARASKRKLEERLPAWPARVLRWRGPGRG